MLKILVGRHGHGRETLFGVMESGMQTQMRRRFRSYRIAHFKSDLTK